MIDLDEEPQKKNILHPFASRVQRKKKVDVQTLTDKEYFQMTFTNQLFSRIKLTIERRRSDFSLKKNKNCKTGFQLQIDNGKNN